MTSFEDDYKKYQIEYSRIEAKAEYLKSKVDQEKEKKLEELNNEFIKNHPAMGYAKRIELSSFDLKKIVAEEIKKRVRILKTEQTEKSNND